MSMSIAFSISTALRFRISPTNTPTHAPRRAYPRAVDELPNSEPPTPDTAKKNKKYARKPSIFENTIDDLTMKRMGRGSMYYGKREESDDLPPMSEFVPKPDPVVVAGATGRTGQWVALGLLAQEFNVRAITRSLRKAEELLGPSGFNLDIEKADVTKPDMLPSVLQGASALVIAAGAPRWLPGGLDAVDAKGLSALITAARDVVSIKRIVLITTADSGSPRGKARRVAEDILRASGKPFVILRAGNLSDKAGGERKIELRARPDGVSNATLGEVSRIDLAQAVCQVLVHDRYISELQKSDPEGEFNFPDCVVDIENTAAAYVPDRRFWRRELNKISDAFREKTDINEGDDEIDGDAPTSQTSADTGT